MNSNIGRSKGEASLTRRDKGFTVPASPFNAVKLDLALIVIVGLVLLVIHTRLVADQFGQFLLLAGYGFAAMAWIVFRTRRTARRLAEVGKVEAGAPGAEKGTDHGAQ